MIKKKKKIGIDQIISRRKSLTASGKGKAATWTRVSSEEQYKSNNSIDTQLEACHRYCENNNKEIKYDFGGTFESAKKAGEKFLDMVGVVLNDPEIDTIVVYDYDRFSRNMTEGLTYKGQLNRSGITIRMKVADLRVLGRATQGVKLIDLRGKDYIASITKVPTDDTEEEQAGQTPDGMPAEENIAPESNKTAESDTNTVNNNEE